MTAILLLATLLAALATAFSLRPGSERVYWGFVVSILSLVILSFFGADINRWAFALPLVFTLAYAVTRLARKLARIARALI